MIDELIKVIGSNCPIGRKLMKQIKDVCKNNHKEVDILELNHNQDKLAPDPMVVNLYSFSYILPQNR